MTRNIGAGKLENECGGDFGSDKAGGVFRFDESPVHSVYAIVRGAGPSSVTESVILSESPWGERATREALSILMKNGMVVPVRSGGFRAFVCQQAADRGGDDVQVRRYPEMIPGDDEGEGAE